MKTAISLPDELFEQAERLAQRMRKSRSQLYSAALAEFLANHAPETVTERWNEVCDDVDERIDPLVASAAQSVLEQTEW